MKFLIKLFIVLSILLVSCQEQNRVTSNKIVTIDKEHERIINHILDFFNKNAYQPELEVYHSEISNTGQTISQKVYNVALSRLVYGLSYSSIINTSNLEKAEKAVDFQLANLVAEDSIGKYFISYFDTKSMSPDSSTNLDIWQQAYGLCGLSELYRNYPTEALLSTIHQLHDAFVNRFHDKVNGGFYGNYNIKTGSVSGSKSLQTLVYPITAYMENLWLADSKNKNKYEPYLKENLSIAYENAWNEKLEWVNIKFDDEWNFCEHSSDEKPCFTVSPGHNFQFASLLLRTGYWNFLTDEEQKKYRKLGTEILSKTLEKPIYSSNDLSQGFFSEVNPVTNEVIDDRKTWWQHCEALVALSLAGEKFEDKTIELKKFYFNTFMDLKHGGEFFYLDKNNNPQTEELKGNIGKSAYHTIEMIRFLDNNILRKSDGKR